MPRFSAILMDHFSNPRNVGRLENPDAVGTTGGPSRPPHMIIHFRLSDGVVAEVRYQTFGCGAAIAAGSMLTEMITNRSIEECLAVTEQQLAEALQLPSDKRWCAKLALSAMRNALENHHGEEQ